MPSAAATRCASPGVVRNLPGGRTPASDRRGRHHRQDRCWRLRGQRHRHVRRQRPLPPDQVAGDGTPADAETRPRHDLYTDRRTYTPVLLLRMPTPYESSGWVSSGVSPWPAWSGICAGSPLRAAHRWLYLGRVGSPCPPSRCCCTVSPPRDWFSSSPAGCSTPSAPSAITALANPAPEVFGFHEVFHAFVSAAVACHYLAIAIFVL